MAGIEVALGLNVKPTKNKYLISAQTYVNTILVKGGIKDNAN